MSPLRPRRCPRRWRLVSQRAAVAVVLREGSRGDEVLLMERAVRNSDPWSGHVSFPGGFAEPQDRSDRDTAVRETREEVGLDLEHTPVLGVLDAHLVYTPRYGWGRPFAVTPVVFGFEGTAAVDLNYEATAHFWVPLAHLRDPASRTWKRFRRLGPPIPVPGWSWEGRVIWGLTRSMLRELLQRLG